MDTTWYEVQLLANKIYTWYMYCSRMASLDDADTIVPIGQFKRDARISPLDRVQKKRQGVRLTFFTRGPRHGIDFLDNSCTRVGRTRVFKYVTFHDRYLSRLFHGRSCFRVRKVLPDGFVPRSQLPQSLSVTGSESAKIEPAIYEQPRNRSPEPPAPQSIKIPSFDKLALELFPAWLSP